MSNTPNSTYNPMAGAYRADPGMTYRAPAALIDLEQVEKFAEEMREYRMLRRRYDEIMAAIQAGQVGPNDVEVLFELGQIADLLGLAPVTLGDESEAGHAYERDDRDPAYWRTNQTELMQELEEHDRNCRCEKCDGQP